METDYYYCSFEDDWFDHRRKLTKEEENEWLRSYYERQKQIADNPPDEDKWNK